VLCSFVSSARRRYSCWIALSALFGLLATVVTGEMMIGWEFLLIDIPLAAGSALATMIVGHYLKAAARNR
jgi:hypothetical protein